MMINTFFHNLFAIASWIIPLVTGNDKFVYANV